MTADTVVTTDVTPDRASDAPTGGRLKLVGLIVAVVGLLVAFRYLPINDYLASFLEYLQSLGVWGPVLLAAAYVVATVFMAPGLILTLGAGFAFGVVTGTIAVSIGSVLGATAAFLIGRYFARGFVQQQTKNFPKFAAVDRAVEASGFKIVMLTRLSPVFPFNVLNYLYGATSVSLKDYVLASWIGMLPGTILYVYFGTVAKSLTDLLAGKIEGGVGQTVLLGVGLLATVIVTVYVTRIAGAAIKRYVPAEQDAPTV